MEEGGEFPKKEKKLWVVNELIKDQRSKSSEIEDPTDGDARGVWCSSVADETIKSE